MDVPQDFWTHSHNTKHIIPARLPEHTAKPVGRRSAISGGPPWILCLSPRGCSCSLVLPFCTHFPDLQIWTGKRNLRLPGQGLTHELELDFSTNVELTWCSFSVISVLRQFHPWVELLTPFLRRDFRVLREVEKCQNREYFNSAKVHFSRFCPSVQIFTLEAWGGGASVYIRKHISSWRLKIFQNKVSRMYFSTCTTMPPDPPVGGKNRVSSSPNLSSRQN